MNWISIKDELPSVNENVLISLDKYGTLLTIAYLCDGRGFDWDEQAEEEYGLTEEEWNEGRFWFQQPFSPWHQIDLEKVFWWMAIPELEN